MARVLFITLFICSMLCKFTFAQLPVEVFAGYQKTTFDLMFFRYVKQKDATNSRLLFFNRNRVSMDYRQTTTTYLPSFGFTEAVSYNHPRLKGFAPVAVAQVTNKGVYPKAGIQYYHRKKDLTFFSWGVCETRKDPYLDWFVLTRYEPVLSGKLRLFTQLELVNAFPTANAANYSFIQRVRAGIRIREWQLGAGADFTQSGVNTFIQTKNLGGFLRHEF